jgi:hypothetical protein
VLLISSQFNSYLSLLGVNMKRVIVSLSIFVVALGTLSTPVLAAPANSTVYSKTVSGKCAATSTKVTASKTQQVTWQWTNGTVGKKKITKGKVMCKSMTSKVPPGEATYNAQGVMTALPKNFPKNPTVKDIQSLGLNADSKVSPQLRIPKPSGDPLAVGVLANTVKPVSVSRPFTVTQIDAWGDTSSKRVFDVTWDLAGGSGLVRTVRYDPASNTYVQSYTELNPNGVTRITSTNWSEGEGSKSPYIELIGSVHANYGQADLPFSTTRDWKLPYVGAGPTRFGTPTGQNTNLDTEGSKVKVDGYVFLDENLNMEYLDY